MSIANFKSSVIIFTILWEMFICLNCVSQVVDFGDVQLSNFRDSAATLTNPLPISIDVTSSYMKNNPSDYAILSGGAPFTVPPGGTHNVKIRFTPSALGVRDDSLVIEGTFPGSPFYLHLVGNGIPLPVELQTFTAMENASGIFLEWITASETNNFGFEIQKRFKNPTNNDQDHSSFLKIGFVTGSGTSHVEHRYSYFDSDHNVLNEMDDRTFLDYRLKQIDLDGAFSYSQTIRIDRSPGAISLSQIDIYPNPFSSRVSIRWKSQNAILKIYDELGREFMNLSDKSTMHQFLTNLNENVIHLSNLNFPKAGIYFLTYQTNERVQVKPIIYLQ